MKSIRYAIVLFAAAISLSSCAGVRGDVFTGSNTDQVLQAVASSNLSDEDKRKVVAAAMRATFGTYTLAGKTVGQIITEQTAFEVEQNAEQLAEQQREQQQEQVAVAERRQMQQALSVQVLSKGYAPADPFNAGTYQDSLTFNVQFHNTGRKSIRAVKGFIAFNTEFGDRIYRVNLDEENHVMVPGDLYASAYSVDYNQFEGGMVQLRSADLANMKVQWVPLGIIFTDGTQITAEDPDSHQTTQ